MKRIYHILYIVLLGCVCLSSCTEQLDINRTDNTISLRAEVENVMPATRSQSYAEPVANNNITATVWFSTVKGKFPDGTGTDNPKNESTNIPGHYIINFEGEKAVFPYVDNENERPRYPIPDESGTVQKVYCVGFYPSTGWNYVEGTNNNPSNKATHTITGFEDLMFAPPIMGNWNVHFDRQKFLHLLTWLKVCVCTTTTEAGNYWGKLKRITLKNVPSGLQINDLSKMQSEYKVNNDKLILTDGDDGDVSPLYEYDDNGEKKEYDVDIMDEDSGIDSGMDLGINIQDVGSIFCYPQSSYTLEIVCEKGTVTKIISLRSLSGSEIGFPAGMQYVLTLYFHPFNVVEGVCTLNAWDAQNEDLYPNAQ